MHLVLYIYFYASPSIHLILCILFDPSYSKHLIHPSYPIHFILCIALYESDYMPLILRKTYFEMCYFPADTQTDGLTLSGIELIFQQKVISCLFGYSKTRLPKWKYKVAVKPLPFSHFIILVVFIPLSIIWIHSSYSVIFEQMM